MGLPLLGGIGYQSEATRAPWSRSIPFSRVDTASPLEVAAAGLTFGVANTSDPPGELYVAFQDPQLFQLVAPGHTVEATAPFSRVWLLRPATVPADASRSWVIDVSQQKGFSYGPATPRSLRAGAEQLNWLEASVTNAAAAMVATRVGRTSVKARNLSTVNTVYLGGAGVTTANGYPLEPGQELEIAYSGPLYAIAAVAGPTLVRVLEVF